ncbi:MAG: ABC transporter substrate-binding protein, partial [Candidatus Bathyarchaeota archaeon]|nr:ABC transporter substrate-binding protein [Candidatus Bathyarchaeota archaeon]
MSQTGKTFLVAALIVGLLIGVGIGWVVKPTPVGIVSQEEYDALQSQLNTATTNLATVTADRDAKAADLEAVLQEVEGLARALLAAGAEAPIESSVTGEIKIGGLFSLSGVLATFGENEYAAALLAVEHVNAFLGSVGAEWTVSIVPEDTQTTPDLALEKLESLAARGIKLIVGPLASSEVRAIKGYCDSNKILAISQSSTAPDLAIADDYIFRFCPTDKLGQGPAMGRILYDAGIGYVIPVTRNDAWGVGLEEAGRPKFEELGGTFLEGIRYPDTAVEFSAEASDLAAKVASAVDAYG